ncbi:MAG: Lipopolysaccharide export system permease protein LptG [Alphaproteobacteria bacterium MarineAlpha3_Bin5]|nr:LPS export ABC transporter permease LptG [Magnetovibrio sp.]PPR76092.1 MAG: Lipopolysaccharide export system permease protein LptG [Alphaproteobacteria bacterium MarineAlpha3_Bin5]
MRLSAILSIYIGRHFLFSFFSLLSLFLLLILLFDCIELLRRTALQPDITFGMILEMAFLKLPHMGQETSPFAVLFGGMAAFWRLTRTQELAVTRAAGVSAWQFLLPVLLLSVVLGILQMSVLNPIASTMLSRYERLEALRIKGQTQALALSPSGLWLRQMGQRGQSVVHSEQIVQQNNDVELFNITVFLYEGLDNFHGRIDARSATLEDNFWHMRDVWILKPEHPPHYENEYWLETDLTLDKIQDSFSTPETMSFWSLPKFIEALEKTGFSAVRHRLQWHSLLSSPLLMCAMVLISATFTLRQSNKRGAAFVTAGGILTGFLLYFFSDVVFALGLSEKIPPTLAAWAPSGIAMLLGLAMLLHLEDG